jgi:hypothetical protein
MCYPKSHFSKLEIVSFCSTYEMNLKSHVTPRLLIKVYALSSLDTNRNLFYSISIIPNVIRITDILRFV